MHFIVMILFLPSFLREFTLFWCLFFCVNVVALHLTLLVPEEGGKFALPLSYFNIASELKEVLL